MKRLYRFWLIMMCMVLWIGVKFAAEQIDISAEKALYDHSFSFPGLLQNTDLYLWTLCTEEGGTKLLVQNIGDKTISNIEIVFLSLGESFAFEAEALQPGERVWISERTGASFSKDRKLICTSFSIE